VVGLRSIISLDAKTYENNYKLWSAKATVEYINQLGGVDRTNLDFRFDTFVSGKLLCFQKNSH